MGDYVPPSISEGNDTIWVALNTFLIFFMQLGFTFVEAGTIRQKNIVSILMKNTLDVCVGTITWWLFGYSFAFGESRGNGFIGSTAGLYAGRDFSEFNSYLHFMNQWAFASTATTIISGAVAERLKIQGYMIFCFFMTLFIYPIQVHWVWGSEGWLVDNGFADFAGVNAVHMVGGVAGLIATIIIGPRLGRFDKQNERDFRPSSIPYVVLGTILLWFCWYGFNCGTVLDIENNSPLVGSVAMNTTIGAVAGALSVTLINIIIEGRIDYNNGTMNLCMGILAGLVSITGSCNNIHPWAAFIIGFVGGLVHVFYSRGIRRLHIDDPLDASSIHFACGVWGGISTGIFSIEGDKKGLIYGGNLIGIQLLGILCICAWTVILSSIILLILKKTNILRASPEIEQIGFDHIYEQPTIESEQIGFLDQIVSIAKNESKQGTLTFTENDKNVLQQLKKIAILVESLEKKGELEIVSHENGQQNGQAIEMQNRKKTAGSLGLERNDQGAIVPQDKQPKPA